MDNFIHIIEENDLQPEDIEKISAKIYPLETKLKFAAENKLRNAIEFSWRLPYAMACAAYRINPAWWLDLDVRQNPKIWKFMQRVNFDIRGDENEFGLTKLEDPNSGPTSAEVVARGKTFKKESRYRKGSPEPEEFRMTDEEITDKFRSMASRVLSMDKTNKIVKTVFEVEQLGQAAKLMEMVVP